MDVATPVFRRYCPLCKIDASRSDGKRRTDMPYPVGRTTIVWTATAPTGRTATVKQQIIVKDTEGPVIGDVKTNTTRLWPANERMVGVKVSYEAEDLCGGPVKTWLSVESNQWGNGISPDGTSPDWDIINDHFVDLRASSSATENRIYTITVNAADALGNQSTKTATVIVRPPD